MADPFADDTYIVNGKRLMLAIVDEFDRVSKKRKL